MRAWVVMGFVCLGVGCEVSEPEVGWPRLSAKADRADDVPIIGTLSFDSALERDDLGRFEGFTLLAAGGTIDVEVTHEGTSAGADIALAVYGPVEASGGRVLLAQDDDSGWGRLPRIRGLVVGPGEHLVALQRMSAEVDHYRLVASCSDGACMPLPARCDVAVMAGMRACMRGSSDGSVYDRATACSDAEPMGRVHDAVCDGGSAPDWCAWPYERFYREVVPPCASELLQDAAYEGCVLGSTWYESRRSPWTRVLAKETLTAASTLDAREQELVVRAVQASSHSDVVSASEAFERVDEGEVERYELADVSAGRSFVAYIYGAGDNTYGRVFDRQGTVVSDVHDGDLMGCALSPGPILGACRSDDDCGHGLVCGGITEAAHGLGKCGPFEQRVAGDVVCHADHCTPAWLEQRVDDIDGIPIVGLPIERTLVAYGLGTHTREVEVTLELEHPGAGVRATITDPGGRESEVAVNGSTVLRHVGPANGRWRLKLEGPAGAGTLHAFGVRVTSEL